MLQEKDQQSLFLITSLIPVSTRDYFSSVNLNLSNTPGDLPVRLALVLRLVMQAGSPLVIPVAAAAALALGNVLLARNLVISGIIAWFLAPVIHAVAVRAAPEDLLTEAILLGTQGAGIEFPSTYVAIGSALATVATPHLSRRGRLLVWVLVVLVAFARMYGGGHLPIDVIGGLALGLMVGALANLVLGVPHPDLSLSLIRSRRLFPAASTWGIERDCGDLAIRAVRMAQSRPPDVGPHLRSRGGDAARRGQAVAAVLFYRLLTFWLPILPGLFALRRLQQQRSL